MKKTIVALLALGGVAMGAQTIVIGKADTENPWGYGTYATHTDGANSAPIVGGTLSDGATYGMTQSGGKTWICPVLDNWSNAAALADYNSKMGTSLTADQINAGTLSASAAGGSTETFTLDFTGTSYAAGDSITLYAFVGTNHSGNDKPYLTGFAVTGLVDGFTTSIATATGDGWGEVYAQGTNGDGVDLSLVKIEGVLADGLALTLKGAGNKTGFSAVSYDVTAAPAPSPSIPEPTTATLSLLALAGLAARRRRK